MPAKDKLRRTIFRMLYEYSVANPTVDIGALLTEVNGGKEVIRYLPDEILYKKLLYRLNKLKQKETA
jgi:hypothetical protein